MQARLQKADDHDAKQGGEGEGEGGDDNNNDARAKRRRLASFFVESGSTAKRREREEGGGGGSSSSSGVKEAPEVIVAIRKGNIVGTAFHPELTDDSRWHEYFVRIVKEAIDASGRADGRGEAPTATSAASTAVA